MAKDKRDKLILILMVVIVVLVGIIIYAFLVKPALNGMVSKGYELGQSDIINAIIAQVNNTGYVQINMGNNQSMILIPYQPSESES